MVGRIAGMLLLGCLASGAWAQTSAPAADAAHAKLVADLYGQRIAQVLATADSADNVALGREMLLAASDSAHPPALRALLALEAAKVLLPAGGDETAQLAAEALALAEKLAPLPPIEKARLDVQAATAQYEQARRSNAATVPALAEALVRAELALGKLLLADDKADAAATLAGSALTHAKAHRIDRYDPEIADLNRDAKAASALQARLRGAEDVLKRAKAAGEPAAIKTASVAMALIYLRGSGDLAKAAPLLADTHHEYEAAVAALAAYSSDPKNLLPGVSFASTVETLSKIAGSADNAQAKSRLAQCGAAYGRDFLAAHGDDSDAAKVRLLLVQLETLAGDSAGDRFVRKLIANYNGLSGKITPLAAGAIRISYDFSARKQVGDWTAVEGTWDLIANAGALGGEPSSTHHRATAANRLFFQAGKPLAVSLRVSGQQDLNTVLSFTYVSKTSGSTLKREVEFSLGANGNRLSNVNSGGSYLWSDDNVKITPGASYKIDIAWDGEKYAAWNVNGKTLCKVDLLAIMSKVQSCTIQVVLGSDDKPAGFDDVTIEGIPLESPPAAEKPKTE